MRPHRWAVVAHLLVALAGTAAAHEPEPNGADSAPVPLNRVEAAYPAQARAAGVGGVVTLELAVDAAGDVTDVRLVRGAGFGFDESAIAAARTLKFRPATHDGRPVAATVSFEQRFTFRPRVVAETSADGEAPATPPPATATTTASSTTTAAATSAPAAPSYESTVTPRGDELSATSSTIPASDFELRPRTAPSDVLRAVPGLLEVQHQGGGKAAQLFLRGFDADHGTDVALYIDGVPINLPSHAHGQGYADLNFVIPEALAAIEVEKGPYDARYGDFATAGTINLVTRDRFDESSVQYTLGMLPTIAGRAVSSGRFVGIAAPSLPGWAARLHPWVAFEAGYDQGPFERSQQLHRYSLFAKVTYDLAPRSVIGLFVQAYGAGWIGSGQLPEREVAAGRLSPFGSLDPSEGGLTDRQMFTAFLRHREGAHEVDATAYVTRYRLSLWNDFTYFQRDPIHGDEIEQEDARVYAGGKLQWHFHRRWRGVWLRTTLGAEARWDGAAVDAYHAESQNGDFRQRLDAYRHTRLDQLDLAGYAEEDLQLTRWLRVVAALRTDYLSFDVDGDQQGVRQFWTLSPKASVITSALRDGKLDLFLDFGMGFHSNPAEVALHDGQRMTDADGNTFTLHALPKFYGGELGARTHLFDRVDVAAAFWLSYLENETVFDADAGGFVPSAPTRRLGFDLQASVRILRWLAADLELAQASATAVPDGGNGGAIALAPKLYLTGGLTAAHRRTGLRGGLRFRYLADRPAFDEASSTYQMLVGSEPDRVIARGWFIVDAYAAWRWRFLETEAAVQNLFNSTWREAQFGNNSCTRAESADPTNAACSAALPPEMRTGIADVHFTPGVPFNLQLTLRAYF